MKSNGEPERWVLAARLSRVTKKDRERDDALIDGIQTQVTRQHNKTADIEARNGNEPPGADDPRLSSMV